MNYRTIAQMIPAEYRSEILLTNMINTAQAHAGDGFMNQLLVYWRNYVDPNITITCNACIAVILNNWKQILPDLIALERESQLLNSIV